MSSVRLLNGEVMIPVYNINSQQQTNLWVKTVWNQIDKTIKISINEPSYPISLKY